jgi:hypothetical protein
MFHQTDPRSPQRRKRVECISTLPKRNNPQAVAANGKTHYWLEIFKGLFTWKMIFFVWPNKSPLYIRETKMLSRNAKMLKKHHFRRALFKVTHSLKHLTNWSFVLRTSLWPQALKNLGRETPSWIRAWSLIRNEKPIVLFERHCHATEKSVATACARRCRLSRLTGQWTRIE